MDIMCKCVFLFAVVISSWIESCSAHPRVCVIGAGIAGLTSARYLQEEGINFTVLEATKYVGGTWRYDPRVGKDENGLPLFTSMYKHLRTNLPRPAMELRGFPVPSDMSSYPSWYVYYDYIKAYAKHFDLEQHIKFLHLVISVKKQGKVWKVKHKYVPTGEEFEEEYDFIFLGNGHFSKPQLPNIPGEDKFRGTIIHSHDYKLPDPFKCRKVLIVGAGPSGMDIGLDIAEVSKKLIHSHHSKIPFKTPYPPNYLKKPDVKEFNETGVTFVDGTYEDIDDVVYCTGFEYHYPFLDESSGLAVTPRSVVSLYRYMVNINEPTMVVLGLVVRACIVVALDAQSRYATAMVKGNFSLPSKAAMMADWQRRADELKSKGRPMAALHYLEEKEDQYYEALTKESGIDRVPPVLYKIRTKDMQAKLENLYTYRDYVYTIINDNTFIRTLEKEGNIAKRRSSFTCEI